MSYQAMHAAASGMEANLFRLDNIANNVANSGTVGFKSQRVNFEDLFYETIKVPGTLDSNGLLTPVGTSSGLGTKVQSTQLNFTQGALEQTGQELDLAIVGDGFFRVRDATEVVFTRAGNLTKNAEGQLVIASADKGRLLDPPITIPNDATQIGISADGIVSVRLPGQQELTNLGQIQTARFINPKGLLQLGENLFAESSASGPPLAGNPGIEGRGQLRQRFLEQSNVEPVRELVELIKTQRNVELNSQVLQAGDLMLQLLAQLRPF